MYMYTFSNIIHFEVYSNIHSSVIHALELDVIYARPLISGQKIGHNLKKHASNLYHGFRLKNINVFNIIGNNFKNYLKTSIMDFKNNTLFKYNTYNCFLGLKLTRGFFKDLGTSVRTEVPKKSKTEKILSNICGRIFQPKRSCFFWGEYTRQFA